MSSHLFTQLDFVRNNTIKAVQHVTEEEANIVPANFKNNIRWHLGHIYLVHEKFALGSSELPMELPEIFTACFAPGTSPEDWKENPPTLTVLVELLKNQNDRMKEALENRLDLIVSKPFTTKSGLKLEKVIDFLSFNLYHEAIHLSTINSYLKLIK